MPNHVTTMLELARLFVNPIHAMQRAISACTPMSVTISVSIT